MEPEQTIGFASSNSKKNTLIIIILFPYGASHLNGTQHDLKCQLLGGEPALGCFTCMAKDLTSRLPQTNPASGQSCT